jgi:predicted nucleic acid-binding protein
MLERFVDTSGWAAWADRNQLFHAQALAAFGEVWNQGGRLLTTPYILAELTALLTRPLRIPKRQQIQLLDDLRSDPSVEIVPVDAILESAAWQLWRSRPDKEWTLVDCICFVVMEQRGLIEALTSDHHFEQAGFIRLLK